MSKANYKLRRCYSDLSACMDVYSVIQEYCSDEEKKSRIGVILILMKEAMSAVSTIIKEDSNVL